MVIRVKEALPLGARRQAPGIVVGISFWFSP
jgi:hypothetical protein